MSGARWPSSSSWNSCNRIASETLRRREQRGKIVSTGASIEVIRGVTVDHISRDAHPGRDEGTRATGGLRCSRRTSIRRARPPGRPGACYAARGARCEAGAVLRASVPAHEGRAWGGIVGGGFALDQAAGPAGWSASEAAPQPRAPGELLEWFVEAAEHPVLLAEHAAARVDLALHVDDVVEA